MIPPTEPVKPDQPVPFAAFLENFKSKVSHVFHNRENIDQLSVSRGIPPFALREILASDPLSAAIPEKFGGRGGHVQECLSLMEAASYESLALSLTFGINIALFLQPLSKYGDESVQASVFQGILRDKKMGGLMITEPGFGSDALHMQTCHVREEGDYRIRGTKHWAGLTGWADYWLLTAREQTASGNLSRDVDMFVCDVNLPGQTIVVEERFNNLGLYMIPYGRNRIDVRVPAIHKLKPHHSGVKMMLDLLHHSRMMMPGTGLGFIHRLLDEAIRHVNERLVGGKPLMRFDQVQERLARIQAAYTACSAMCLYSSKHAGVSNDLTAHGFEANIIKTVVSDLMQESAQSLLQMVGAKGYKLDHIAGRSIVDSRPFQIFEGSNDILYTQITESLLKTMKSRKEKNLLCFLKTISPAVQEATETLKELFGFEPDFHMAQRKQIELGRAVARLFCMGLILEQEYAGFRKDLTMNASRIFQQDVTRIMSNFNFSQSANVVEEFREQSAWLEFA